VPFAPVQAEIIVTSAVHFLDRYLNGRSSLHALLEDGNVPGVAALFQDR
jgi:hypothetical protein